MASSKGIDIAVRVTINDPAPDVIDLAVSIKGEKCSRQRWAAARGPAATPQSTGLRMKPTEYRLNLCSAERGRGSESHAKNGA